MEVAEQPALDLEQLDAWLLVELAFGDDAVELQREVERFLRIERELLGLAVEVAGRGERIAAAEIAIGDGLDVAFTRGQLGPRLRESGRRSKVERRVGGPALH